MDQAPENNGPDPRRTHRGRGASGNPTGRFERIERQFDEDWTGEDDPAPTTVFLRDTSRSIVARNDSPDIPFSASINPYRGCEHGCSYCYARPTHEYFGFSAGLDFETKILVKEQAPDLLRRKLQSRVWKPEPLAMSGVSDPYQPVEKRLELTRRCLQVLAEFRNPVFIITKNHLVTRDIDLLGELAAFGACSVTLSITTLDPALVRKMEPRTSQPQRRLDALGALCAAGIPCGVSLGPIVPGLTDHEIPSIIAAAADSGAGFAGYEPLRLPFGVKDIFAEWLQRHYPDRKNKVLNRVRSIRGGNLNDARFFSRMRGEGLWADFIRKSFEIACRRAGIRTDGPALSTSAFRRASDQPSLFTLPDPLS